MAASGGARKLTQETDLARTPLWALHQDLGARMVAFAGTDMPLQYKPGIVAEHLHTRAAASLFDVSHMGQAILRGAEFADLAAAFEALVPGDIVGLEPGAMRYTLLLNETGGILDDLIVMRSPKPNPDGLLIVANAARKAQDFAHISAALPELDFTETKSRALLALQGPKAFDVLCQALPEHEKDLAETRFMYGFAAEFDGTPLIISRSGYTGEDGFEISISNDAAKRLAHALLADTDVRMAGLGARDSLRLEAGFCLYGHDLDATISPVEASLAWTIAKRRRVADSFPGSARILAELDSRPKRRRVGMKPDSRSIVREGNGITDTQGVQIGVVTSGTYGPTVGGPIAMGYVPAVHSAPGTELLLPVRGKPVPAEIVELPFVAARTART